MYRKIFFTLTVAFFATISAVAGNDDVMITRDGAMLKVKTLRINQSQVVFIDLNHRRKGEMKAPADYIYMIWKEKGSCICFDEEGNQTTQPTHEIEDKETTLFLNNGKFYTVYNLSVNKDDVTYQMKDKKKAPFYKSEKSEVFMVRNSDGTTTLYNNNYIEKHKKPVQQPQPASQSLVNTPSPASTVKLQASVPPAKKDFYPAPDLSPQELEVKINAVQPYTLFRKGSVAEYVIEQDGVRTRFLGGPSYVQQVVQDLKIENGLMVAYVQQLLFNKKHEPSKGVSAKYKSYYYPTEIDSAGNFHLTHDISRDFIMLTKRNGYAMLIPGAVSAGERLMCSTIHDDATNLFGGAVKVKAEYKDFEVVGEELVTVPAGTFTCIKLTGNVTESMPAVTNYKYTWWLARGIGFVKYEIQTVDDRSNKLTTILLNKIDLK